MGETSAGPTFCQTGKLWAERTTLHSIYDLVFSGSKIVSLFWLFIFVACNAVVTIQIVSLMDNFLKEPHYRTNMFVTDKMGMELPNVTVCNMNRVNRTKAQELGMTPDAISQLFVALMTKADIPSAVDPGLVLKQSRVYNAFLAQDSILTRDPKELLRLVGHGCEETFKRCHFNGVTFPCCEHATEIINGEYGLCWSISPPTNEKDGIPRQALSGIMYGLKMFMQPHLNEYSGDVVYNNILEEGLILDANRNPLITHFLNPTVIPPGQHARISIAPEVKYTDVPTSFAIFPPFCAKSGAKLEYLKGPYTKNACSNDCMQRMTYESCNCTYLSETKPQYRTCEPFDWLTCVFPTFLENYQPKQSTIDRIRKCKTKCAEPCDMSSRVDTSLSMTHFPAERFVRPLAVLLNLTLDEVRALIVVDLYFPQDTSLVIQSVEKTPISELIGNIGGQLGLWLGASVITMVQTIYYLFYAIKNHLNRKLAVVVVATRKLTTHKVSIKL